MSIFALSALINLLTNTILGLLVFLGSKKDRVHVSFSLYAFILAFWSFAYFLWQVATNSTSALFWSHMLMAGAIFIAPLHLNFVINYIKRQDSFFWLNLFGYIFAVIFSFINWFSPNFISGIQARSVFLFWPVAGHLFLPFLVIWLFYALFPVGLLIHYMHKGDDAVKKATWYIIVGTIIGYVGGSTNYFLWFNIPVLPYGNIGVSIYVAFVAYAITRHHFLNLKVIATEMLVFSLWLVIFVRAALAESMSDRVSTVIQLMITLLVGVFLIRGVEKEVEQREKIELQEKELEERTTRLQELDHQKSEFLSFASHQLRTPLTAIKWSAGSLIDGTYGKVPQNLAEPIETILEESARMAVLVNDYLNVSRIEQGRMEYHFAEINLSDAIQEVATELEPQLNKKGLTLKVELPKEPAVVWGDRGKLTQIFGNIVDNSLKYTPEGSIAMSLHVNKKEKTARVEIRDTGIGMDAENAKKIFEKYVRGDNAIEINSAGSGLGLFIVRTFVAAHKGKIWAESDGINKGTRFLVEFPLLEPK